jgi:hypothetical protein
VAGSSTAKVGSVSPDGHRSLRRSRLAVILDCSSAGSCYAHGRGGSGTYTDYEWWGASEQFDEGGPWSAADASMHCGVPGDMISVSVAVTDSNGVKAFASTWVFCG